jgi:hypothetical protein
MSPMSRQGKDSGSHALFFRPPPSITASFDARRYTAATLRLSFRAMTLVFVFSRKRLQHAHLILRPRTGPRYLLRHFVPHKNRLSRIVTQYGGGNVTGINVLGQEILAKQLELLHKLVPKTVRVAVLVNPANAANTETTLQAAPYAARALRLKIQVFKTSSIREI